MESMTNHLFTPLKEKCPICQSDKMNKINGMVICENCGDYLILKPMGNIKETIRPLKKHF